MTDMPKAGFLCAGKTPLQLSVSISCAHRLMDYLRENGFGTGACYTEITEPYTETKLKRAEKTLKSLCGCCELVMTVGCDGFSTSDFMPDITESICKKQVPFFTSALCSAVTVGTSQINGEKVKRIRPSRAVSGICGEALVLNLPGDYIAAYSLVSELISAIVFSVYNLSGKSAASVIEYEKFVKSSPEFHKVFNKKENVNL